MRLVSDSEEVQEIFFFPPPQCHHMSLMDFSWFSPSRLWPSVTDFWGWDAYEARGYAIPMRCMVIYGYEVTGEALNLSSTTLPRPWSPWVLSPFRKKPHGRTGNRTRDLMISSQRLWPLDHEAGPVKTLYLKIVHFLAYSWMSGVVK